MFDDVPQEFFVSLHIANFWGIICASILLCFTAAIREGRTAPGWLALDALSVLGLLALGSISITALAFRVVYLYPWYLLGPQVVYSIVFVVGFMMAGRKLVDVEVRLDIKKIRRRRKTSGCCAIIAMLTLVGSEKTRSYYLANFRDYFEKNFGYTQCSCIFEQHIRVDVEERRKKDYAAGPNIQCDFSDGTLIEIQEDQYRVSTLIRGQRKFAEYNDREAVSQGALEMKEGGKYYIALDRKTVPNDAMRIAQTLSSVGGARIYRLFRSDNWFDNVDESSLSKQHALYRLLDRPRQALPRYGSQWKYSLYNGGAWFDNNAIFCREFVKELRPELLELGCEKLGEKTGTGLILPHFLEGIEACDRDIDFEALKILVYFLLTPEIYDVQEIDAGSLISVPDLDGSPAQCPKSSP